MKLDPKDQKATLMLVGGVVGIFFALKALIFLPVIMVGTILGTGIGSYAFNQKLFRNKLRVSVLSFLGIIISMCLLFGTPIMSKNIAKKYLGFIYTTYSDKLVTSYIATWNSIMTSNLFRINDANITVPMVQYYYWSVVLFALVTFALTYYFLDAKGKNKATRIAASIGKIVTNYGTKLIRLLTGQYIFRFGMRLSEMGIPFGLITFSGIMLIFGLFIEIPLEKGYIVVPKGIENMYYVLVKLTLSLSALGFALDQFKLSYKVLNFLGYYGRIDSKKNKKHGFELGEDEDGAPYILSEKNLEMHVELVAPTGSGKTTILKSLMLDRIQKGKGLIFLDYKADFEVLDFIYKSAKANNRLVDLELISLADPDISLPYNPIATGDAPAIHSRIMNSLKWSNDYYRSCSSTALIGISRALCAFRDYKNQTFHLGHILEILEEPSKLQIIANKIKQNDEELSIQTAQLASKLSKKSEQENLIGLISGLQEQLFSAAGSLLTKDNIGKSFSFEESITNNKITLILMNSLALNESASGLGRIILQDLMSYIGRKYSLSDIKKPNKTTLIIDEFASFATKEFISFMDRARGAGIGLVLAHQNRSDLEAIEAGFQKRLESNANTKIVSGIDDAKDAEYYAAMIGTRSSTAETWQEESQLFGGSLATGLKSVREVQEYRVHPNQIKELKQGQVFIYSKSVDVDYGIVNTHLPKEPKIQLQENEVRSFFELRRKNAMTETKIKLIELKVNHNASQEPDPNVQMNSSKQLTSDLWA